MERVRLIALTKEASKQPILNSGLWYLLKKNILIKCNKLRKEKYKMYSLNSKGALGRSMELNHVFK